MLIVLILLQYNKSSSKDPLGSGFCEGRVWVPCGLILLEVNYYNQLIVVMC